MKRALFIVMLAILVFSPLVGFAQSEVVFKYPFETGKTLPAGRSILIRGDLPDNTVSVNAFSCVGTDADCQMENIKTNPKPGKPFIPVVGVKVDKDHKIWEANVTVPSTPKPFNFIVVYYRQMTDEEKTALKKKVWAVVNEYALWRFVNTKITPEQDRHQLETIYRKPEYFPADKDKYLVGEATLLETILKWHGSDAKRNNDLVAAINNLDRGKLVKYGEKGLEITDQAQCISETKDKRSCDNNLKTLQNMFAELDAIVTFNVEVYSTSVSTAPIEEIRKWLGFNAGLAYIGAIDEIQPYIGLSIYFVNADTFNPNDYSPSGLCSRISLAGGYSFASDVFPMDDKNVSNLFFIGVGFRLNPFANIIAGESIYDLALEDGGHGQRQAGFVSLTVETFALQTIMENMAKSFVK